MRKAARSESRFAVMDASVFKEAPIVCKEDGRSSCRGCPRRALIRRRPRLEAESADRLESADMREPVHPAAAKRHRRMHRRRAWPYGAPDGEHGARYVLEAAGP